MRLQETDEKGGLRDMSMSAVSSAYSASKTWREVCRHVAYIPTEERSGDRSAMTFVRVHATT
jgi:hypothetical protein